MSHSQAEAMDAAHAADHPTGRSHGKGRSRRWTAWLARRLEARSRSTALAVFRRAAKRVPAYRSLLSGYGVDPASVRRIEDFTRVPVTSKAALFATHPLAQLCVDGKLTDAVCIYTSSGFSGTYSFGAETFSDEKRVRSRIDRMLEMYFGARTQQMLLINALPAGVLTPSRLATVVNTSTRPDAVISIIEHLGDHFDQVLLIAEHPFLKQVIEMGVDSGIDWRRHTLHLVTGAEVIPENFRTYLGHLLGHDPKHPQRGQILVSLGISELSLSLGQETPATRRLRREAVRDASLRQALFGDVPFVPSFVQYDPRSMYIENCLRTDGRPRLIMTPLDLRRKIPLVRYTTDDWAKVYRYEEVAAILKRCGRADLIPPYPLPCVAVWGRGQGVAVDDEMIYPEQIKEALYADHAVAGALTGDFQMRAIDSRLRIRFQMNERPDCPGDLEQRLSDQLERVVTAPIDIILQPFHDFHHVVPLSYQHKRHYIESED